MSDKKRSGGKSSLLSSLLFWLCVAGTLVIVATAGFFYLEFKQVEDNIKGRVVLLDGVSTPAADAGVDEVRDWLKDFSKATPGCLCALGKAVDPKKGQSLIFCIGFHEGDNACGLSPEELPEGVSMTSSEFSDIGSDLKMIFLMQRRASRDIVSPRIDRNLTHP